MRLKESKIHTIVITEDILYYSEMSSLAIRNNNVFGRPSRGIIPQGTKGEIIKKWGKRYFAPYIDQPGIEKFTPPGQPHILIPYRKIKGFYTFI
jgi:hypothetical protein